MAAHSQFGTLSLGEKVADHSGLTHSQIQIWIGQKIHPASPFCNMAFAIEIDGPIDSDRFAQAWLQVVSHSDALRTCIEETDGVPHRKLLPPSALSIQRLDLSNHENPSQRFQKWARQRCSTLLPLDGPLVDSALIKLADNSFGWYLNQHHLVTDASATVRLFRAVSHAYEQLESNPAAQLAPIDDYYGVAKSLASAHLDQREKAKRHWSDKTKNAQRSNAIYGRKSDVSRTESSRHELKLDRAQSDRIRALAELPELQSLFPDVSTFALFSTLLAATLHRITGQRAVSFDSPAANRPTRPAKKSLGCFIEMFPLDFEVESGATFRSLAGHCMEEVQDFLQNVCDGASSPNGSAASNVVLNLFPHSFGAFAGQPVRADWIHSGHIDGVYDFKLQVHDYNCDERYTLQFDLSDDTFSSDDQQRIQVHFIRLLEALLQNPDTVIDSVDILGDEEESRCLADFNESASAPIPSDTVIERIAAQAVATPDRIALRQGSYALTYRQLWNKVETVARALVDRGVKPDSCVALLMPRSSDAVIAVLAILRAGAAFVPIDSTYPLDRIDKILTDSQSVFQLSDLDDLLASPADPETALPELPTSSQLAYVIYTSGSTGQPKGVEIEHGGLIDYIDWAQRSYVRGETLRYPLFTSLAFDLTITSLFLPFVSGGELIVYPQSSDEVDSAVIDVVHENAVDFIKLTPSHLSLLKRLDLSNSRISRLVLGGEDLKSSLASDIIRQFGKPVELYNEYGPTECVVGCMIHRFDPTQDPQNGASVPIGRPADHVSIHLLNEQLQPVPEGVPGELCIARNGMARGYRNDPKKTASSFVPNPFDPSSRLYRTGDLARFSSPGSLTYLGRIDKQIKLRGHRIELGEIETALLRHPAVRDSLVTTRSLAKTPESTKTSARCVRCGIASNYPNLVFNEQGVCSVCSAYESIKDKADAYFQDRSALRKFFEDSRRRHSPAYDCMVFFSGGKDSAYALGNLVDLGLTVYAFTLDNGYLSEQAMGNIRRVVEELGVDHEFATTPAMNEIFRDSLTRYSNVCNGCFKTIYTLGMKRAHELGIPIIVTGLSRGQFYETRLTENLFRGNRFSPQEVDTAVLEARKRYHREQDAVSACIDVSLLQSDEIFEQIQIIDFYRYWDAPLDDIYDYLSHRLPWIRPSDTGRSTNCRVNDVGIYIHNKERGFHNYALPYSWDVRLGQKRRDEAVEELDDRYDLVEVREMLAEIGYDEDRLADTGRNDELVAYYVADSEIETAELARFIAKSLPAPMRPRHFVRLASMPLTPNGKIDTRALPSPASAADRGFSDFVAPQGPVEEHVSKLWGQMLSVSKVGSTDSFFRLGGTSLTAMEITLQLCQDFEIDLPLQSIFTHSTVAELSAEIERAILQQVESLSDEEAAALLDDPTRV